MGSQRWPSSGGGAAWSPGLLDRAETFAESNVTVTHSGSRTVAESIGLGSESTQETTAPAGTNADMNDTGGFYFQPDVLLPRIEVYLDNGNGGHGLYVERVSDGEQLISTTPAAYEYTTLDPGEGVYFQPSEEYVVRSVADYPSGFKPADGFPHAVADLTITDGRFNGGRDNTQLYNFSEIRTHGLNGSGSAVIEWPMPDDVAGWDIIPLQVVEDGGTVDVYAIDTSDGTRLTGALDDPGDISSLSRSTNVAVEVVLESPTGVENPRLEAVYRRRKIT